MKTVIMHYWVLSLFFLVLVSTYTENSNKPLKAVMSAKSTLTKTDSF